MAVDKKNLMAGLAAGVIIGGATLGTIGVSAQEGSTSIVDRLAERFGVESSEVQAEFDSFREDKQGEREATHEAHLQSLVDEGTITAEQKTALEEKQAAMQTTREELKEGDLSREEMRTQMEAALSEFQAWAEEQGIDLEAIKGDRGEGGGHGRGHGHGMRGGFGGPVNDTDDADDGATVEPATT